MNVEQIKKIIKEEFETNLDSGRIFAYVDNLEKENKQLKDRIDKVKQLKKILSKEYLDALPFDLAEDIQDLLDEILNGENDD